MPDPAQRAADGDSPLSAIAGELGALPPEFAGLEALPGVPQAMAALVRAVLDDGALPRRLKQDALLAAAARRGSVYWAVAHAGASEDSSRAERAAAIACGAPSDEDPETALIAFAARVASTPPSATAADVERLRALGATDAQIVEAVQAAALSVLLCVLADGLGAAPERDAPQWLTEALRTRISTAPATPLPAPPPAPFVAVENLSPDEFPPFRALRDALGFVPRVFRAQTPTRRVLEAEAEAALVLGFGGGAPPPTRRGLALLAAAAARLDAYSCALHAERLRGSGVAQAELDALVAGRGAEILSDEDGPLVRFAEELGRGSAAERRGDRERLEVAAAAAFDAFLGTVAAGLGVRPDFRAPKAELEERRAASRPATLAEDPDAALVAAARAGEASAFEELLRRHQARVYRTLAGLTGDPSEAEDGCQAVFLRAFRGIADFAAASRFSTWLTRIAIREGIDRVRRRHPTERLEDVASDEEFRPSLVDPWVEDPERLYAREEVRRLVHRELARLPVRYRAAVMLRDIEQLSTAEAAAALELPVPTLKTRLLRGRLMLREALSAHFSQRPEDERV